MIARHDYLPFGEEILANTAGRNSQWGPLNDTVAQKFTGQTRDSETATDFFNARYFGPALGRFTSPDPANAGADIMNPQSWNAYAYVVGNPLNAVDPSGMWNWGLGNCYYNTVAAYVDGQFQGYDTQFLGCFDFPNFGNGLRTGGGRSAGGARKAKPPKIDCSHAPPMPPTPREANVDANELAVRIAAQEQQAALLAAARAGQAGAADNGFSFWISKVPPYAAWDYKTNLDLSTRPSAISTLVQLAISSAWPCMCVRGVRGQRHMAPLRSRSRKKGSRTRGVPDYVQVDCRPR